MLFLITDTFYAKNGYRMILQKLPFHYLKSLFVHVSTDTTLIIEWKIYHYLYT